MTHYYALVHKDKNSAYGVEFPDLPGCFSASDDSANIIANAMEALELYVEDLDALPSPSKIDVLSLNSDIANELKQGAFFGCCTLDNKHRKICAHQYNFRQRPALCN